MSGLVEPARNDLPGPRMHQHATVFVVYHGPSSLFGASFELLFVTRVQMFPTSTSACDIVGIVDEHANTIATFYFL